MEFCKIIKEFLKFVLLFFYWKDWVDNFINGRLINYYSRI